jgi:hypothetical protein
MVIGDTGKGVKEDSQLIVDYLRIDLVVWMLEILGKRGVCDRDQVIEEPDEVQVSRPVLKPSGGGDPTA